MLFCSAFLHFYKIKIVLFCAAAACAFGQEVLVPGGGFVEGGAADTRADSFVEVQEKFDEKESIDTSFGGLGSSGLGGGYGGYGGGYGGLGGFGYDASYGEQYESVKKVCSDQPLLHRLPFNSSNRTC